MAQLILTDGMDDFEVVRCPIAIIMESSDDEGGYYWTVTPYGQHRPATQGWTRMQHGAEVLAMLAYRFFEEAE